MMASLRNLAITLFRIAGACNVAAAIRTCANAHIALRMIGL
jgi:hypothetical protein